jgi:hypothetical protein
MSLRSKVLVALVGWTVVLGVIFLLKHPRIATILSTTSGEVRYPPQPDHGEPQLVAWVIGVALIVAVALLARRRASRS